MKFIIRIFIVAFSLIVVAYIVPGISVDGVYTALIVALLLGLLNAIVRPLLVLLTLPITLLTLGLFIFVINAGIFLFVSNIVEGFTVHGFVSALIGSVLVSITSGIMHKLT